MVKIKKWHRILFAAVLSLIGGSLLFFTGCAERTERIAAFNLNPKDDCWEMYARSNYQSVEICRIRKILERMEQRGKINEHLN